MRNILKPIYRNFSRKPVTNLINLGGLALSLSLVIVLAVYAYSELTTDHFHKNGNRVYLYSESGNLPRIYTPGVLKDAIDQNIPEVESTLRIAGTWEAPVFQAEDQEPITSDLLDRFNMVAKKDLFPQQLSGGQQQLVGIARAIIVSDFGESK